MGTLEGQFTTFQDTFLFAPSHLIDTLSHGPVIQGSWTLHDRESGLVDSGQVQLDPLTGIVRWHGPLDKERWVAVRYQVWDGLTTTVFGPAWRYLPPLSTLVSDSLNRASATPAVPANPGYATDNRSERLVTAGTLFRGLTLASGQGASITGGLNLRLQGELAKGVFINGSLTDQNLPIQPEGDTRTLNELDQVRLSISSGWGRVEVGDFLLRSQGQRLSTFERKLEGMHVTLRRGPWQTEGALAGSQGRYRSQSFQGTDGSQGPYVLTSHEGSRTLIILAGTEAVWLNGRQLQRGESLDYTIDYTTGEITFTPRHTIRNDSRIVVDFEYTDLVYNRTTGYLSSRWRSDRSTLAFTAFTERDNLESNLEFSLSTEDRRALAQIGDRLEGATVSTAVEDSAGSYDLENGHYVWRGPDQGRYTVRFFNAGDQGEYRRVVEGNRLVYRWVPPQDRVQYQAAYAPFRQLKLPQTQDFIGASWQLKGQADGRSAEVELGISQLDRNRFSSLDDQDNRAGGYAVGFQWQTRPWMALDRAFNAGIKIDGLGKGRNFQPPGRLDVVEFGRSWDIDGRPDRYDWQTVNLFLKEGDRHGVFAELGRIETDTTRIGRLRWGFDRKGDTPVTGYFRQTNLSRPEGDRRWRVTEIDLRSQLGKLAPFVTYLGEDRMRSPVDGYQVEQLNVGLMAQLTQRTQVGLSRERRRDAFLTGGRETAHLWRFSYAHRVPRGTRLEVSMSLNEKVSSDNPADGEGNSQKLSYLMGSLALVHRPVGRPWWVDLRYRLERSVAETKAVIYQSVGPGLGQYRYDPIYETYVPDEAGSFSRFVIPAGVLRPVNKVTSRIRSQVDLNRLEGPLGLLRGYAEARLILQGRLTAETERHTLSTYRKPALEDSSALSYQSRFQMDLALQSRRHRPQYKLRLNRSVRLNRARVAGTGSGASVGRSDALLGEAGEQSTLDLGRVGRFPIGGELANLETHIIFGHESILSLTSALRNHEIRRWEGHGTLSRSLGNRFTVSLTGRWRQEVDGALENLKVITGSYSVGLQRSLGGTGRFRVDLERLNVAASREVAIPYLLAEGFPAGRSLRIRASSQFNLFSNLILTLSLFSRREAGRTPFTTASMELRTQF